MTILLFRPVRGHGRSSQPWQRDDLDTYADDLAGGLPIEVFDQIRAGACSGTMRHAGAALGFASLGAIFT
jgi:hypothetical protein